MGSEAHDDDDDDTDHREAIYAAPVPIDLAEEENDDEDDYEDVECVIHHPKWCIGIRQFVSLSNLSIVPICIIVWYSYSGIH